MEQSSRLPDDRKDYHSYSNPEQIRIRHVALDLEVDFATRTLHGTATLNIDRSKDYRQGPIILDSRALKIEKAETSTDNMNYTDTRFEVGSNDAILGAPLTVQVPEQARSVRITYTTSPDASGLQWLGPPQTAGKKHPFLYSQGEAIHTRSWIPLQDSPGVRITYSAKIRAPKGLLAVMSAEADTKNAEKTGFYRFEMPQPIPSYLIALAVGDLNFKALSRRIFVYAEPPLIDAAAHEFEDTEDMIVAAESLYGQYRWERYDILVLPPSFPYGGMENPRLTFATPTVIAGDKSLVSLIAHELAHSWSGNLVTNATWRDFWLNEGFTTYVERRIQEKVFGPERSEMEAVIERRELEQEMKTLKPADQLLHPDLKGRDPDDSATLVPYVKGMLFLRNLEEVFGRPRFDSFLRSYFDVFGMQSITTADFLDYLKRHLFDGLPDNARRIPLDEWIEKPGLPASAPQPHSDLLTKAEAAAQGWMNGTISTENLPAKKWSTQEWLHFLRSLPDQLDKKKMAALDGAYQLTKIGNDEILDQWLLMAVRNGYEPTNPRLEQFLIQVGRRKYIKPLYQELAKTPEGMNRARTIYKKARPGYHPISAATIDQILK